MKEQPLNSEELKKLYAARDAFEREHGRPADFFELMRLCLDVKKANNATA